VTRGGNTPDFWNREHLWAKSHGFPGESQHAFTDAHHLRAADKSVNGDRGNLDFDEGGRPIPLPLDYHVHQMRSPTSPLREVSSTASSCLRGQDSSRSSSRKWPDRRSIIALPARVVQAGQCLGPRRSE
jgi:hypothetical protein